MLQVSGSGRDRCLTNTFWLESITGFYYPDTLIRRAEYTVNIFLSVSHTKSLSQKSVKNVKRFRQLIMTPFLITNHQPLFHMCITLPVKSAPFFIPPTSFCSLSSWFTSSCAYHLITVTTFALITYHCLYLSLQT